MDLWDRLAAALSRLPEEIAADRERAPGLLAELLGEPPAVRERMAVHVERFRSIALAELLLERSLQQPAMAGELADLALGVAGVLDRSGGAAGLIDQITSRAWSARGNSHRLQGDFAEAESAFQRASYYLAISPDPLEESLFYRLRARLRRDQGNLESAVVMQERAVERLAGYAPPALTAEALIELAALHLAESNTGKTLAALAAATQVLERS